MRAIGHVDLDAVNKYKEVKERYDYMSEQIGDLEKSKAELAGGIVLVGLGIKILLEGLGIL